MLMITKSPEILQYWRKRASPPNVDGSGLQARLRCVYLSKSQGQYMGMIQANRLRQWEEQRSQPAHFRCEHKESQWPGLLSVENWAVPCFAKAGIML